MSGLRADARRAQRPRRAACPALLAHRLHLIGGRRRLHPAHERAELLGRGRGARSRRARAPRRARPPSGSAAPGRARARARAPRRARRGSVCRASRSGSMRQSRIARRTASCPLPAKSGLPRSISASTTAEREQVGALVERLAGDLLRRQVRELALEHGAAGRCASSRGSPSARCRSRRASPARRRRGRGSTGVTSRWMMPSGCPLASRAVWTLSSARRTSRATCTATPRPSFRPSLASRRSRRIEIAAVDQLHREPGLVAHRCPSRRPATTFSWCTAACSAASRSNIVRPSGSVTKCGSRRLTMSLRGSRLGVDRPGDVDLCRAAHGEPRVEPVRPELDRAARERARYSSAAGFRPTASQGECIYAGASRTDHGSACATLLRSPSRLAALLWCALGLAGVPGVPFDAAAGRAVPPAGPGGGRRPPTVRLYLVTDLGGRPRALRLHEGPARGARSLRRVGQAEQRARARRRSWPPPARSSSWTPARGRTRRPGPHQGRDDCAGLSRARPRGVRAGRQRLGRRERRRSPSWPRRAAPRSRSMRPRADGRRSSARSAGLKVGFVGYGQPGRRTRRRPTSRMPSKRGVEDAKRQGAKVLVALAAVGRGEAKRIADAVPELTAVVVGSAEVERRREHDGAAGRAGGRRADRPGRPTTCRASAVLDLYVREPLAPGTS